MSKEAMKLALEALEDISQMQNHSNSGDSSDVDKAIKALEEALAKQEPKPFGYTLEETMKCCDLGYAAAVKALAQQEQSTECVGEPLKGMSEINRTIAYCAASKLREIGYEWDGKNWAKQEQGEPVGDGINEAAFLERFQQNLDRGHKPCQTCEALARTVMLDQSSHDTTPQQRPSRSDIKPLTDEQIKNVWGIHDDDDDFTNIVYERDITRAIEAAHGIKENT